MPRQLYTIGHSNHSADEFTALLRNAGVQVVCDVRSQPYSRRYPHFRREFLRTALKNSGVGYVFLGDCLGGRSSDPGCHSGGRVDYRRLATTPVFRQGIERLRQGLAQHRIVLMCAERDPLACHRMILVCRNLRDLDVSIQHIREDGSLESHEAAEERLLSLYNGGQCDLFSDRAQRLEHAYDLRGTEIAYAVNESGD